jgi:hypothetical protein
VCADLAAILGIHDALKQGAEDGGRDVRPVKAAGGCEAVVHVAVEPGGGEALGEEFAVDIGEGVQVFVEKVGALVRRRVEHVEEGVELGAEVGTVLAGAVLKEKFELSSLEDARIVGEKTEEQAHEEAFERGGGIIGPRHDVVKPGHDAGGLEVEFVLFAETVGLLADEEGEVLDVGVEVAQGNSMRPSSPPRVQGCRARGG